VLAQFSNAGVYTPNLLHLPILLGFAFLLALFTVIKDNPFRLQGVSDKDLFLSSWFWSNFLLIYIPTDFQIHMLNGWQVPIAILAVQGLFRYLKPALEKFLSKRRRPLSSVTIQRFLGIGIILIILPTNLYLWAWRFVDLSRHDYPYYLNKDEISALNWLDKNASPDSVVLSSLTIGEFIPATTGAHAFLAHWAQTVDFYGKTNMVNEFFASGTSDSRRQQILAEYRVNYVFYGPAEKALGGYQPGDSNYLELVFSAPAGKVYAVRTTAP